MNRVALPCAQYIRDIARGRENPRDLSQADAKTLWDAVLSGSIGDLELGAVLVAMRVKGESVDELAGFLEACDVHGLRLAPPPGGKTPVVIPSYNGARKLANLTPLLAILLARAGVPVLVHGKVGDGDAAPVGVPVVRTTSAEIFSALGFSAARNAGDVATNLARGEPSFLPLPALNPALARVLALRRLLGVRNSAHSLVKMLQPFEGPALRLASYTHPEYHKLLSAYYLRHCGPAQGQVLLARGTEGEVVANSKRAAAIEWIHEGRIEVVNAVDNAPITALPGLPENRDAATTARWIQAVLSGERPVPEPIAEQVRVIVRVLRSMG